MNWLKNFVRPKLQKLVGGGKDIPENLWNKCPECSQMIFHRDMEKNLHVCQHCGHHMRLSAKRRLDMLFDEGAYKTVEIGDTLDDPLKFRDRRKYTERLKESRDKNGEDDALMVAHGSMGGLNVVVAALDFGFMGGSMGIAVGEGLLTAARLAVVQEAPLVVVPSSGGARMQEGILSLMQMARSTIAVQEVRDAGLPYVVVLSDPTTGGVSASFAMLGDIAIAEPGAIIGFAGARVIEQTIRETLPEGFQRSEYLYEHGMVDMVVHRSELRDTLVQVLSLLRNPSPPATALPMPNIHPSGNSGKGA
ncbi:MAG: acetyl-CoA carboxylase carboxyltransferase subunit beta [Alphaproteobacteria bacterium]|jgi:acetyl-CoA carboxylase carboxyl transferase subunit beta|nr:acetyl-CoA carboxylase carboxyltransferase subunit beta [Alphaproteobacteria bacterium]MBT7944164.1 acetyl-CoA carboxylase carboxyltransferase subunit beta [Alphaproteobacteria bacterium]